MLPADVARCGGEHCLVREHCLRFTTPSVPNHPNQSHMPSPHPDSKENVECDSFMYELEPGDKGSFFHPLTMGVMHGATVVTVLSNLAVRVKFDMDYNDTKGKKTFITVPNHNQQVK
jgi:hypothetical protein